MKYRVLFLLLFAGCLSTNAAVRVTGMKVSGLVAPLGIDETPTFSWQTESDERGFQQQSYAITVTDASGKKVWQSGVVTSDAQSNIRYEGMPLRSRAAYRWTVRIAGTKGEVSKVAASTFETAFLDASEWKAEWIGGERSAAVPYYGTHFEVGKKKVVRARIYATALGVFTMKVNGAAVTENQLEPGESEFVKTVQYATYDVTPLLRHGRNTIVAQVGGGIFNVAKVGANGGLTERYCKEISNQGDVCLKAEVYIEYADGTTETVLTDGTWLTHPSPTTGSNWWGGEDYDATREIPDIGSPDYDFDGWKAVQVVEHPQFKCGQSSGEVGVLKSRSYEPVRVVESWKAVSVTPVTLDGKQAYVIDFGKNFAGTFRFSLRGKRGQVITLRTGHLLDAEGKVKQETFNAWPYDIYDTYIFKGEGSVEQWGPTFMYHGTRYLQILGLTEPPTPEQFTALRMRAAVEQTGEFVTSNTLLNDIHTICRDGIQSQIYNAFTDCPHREKLGWLDVPNELYYSIGYNYDMAAFWSKTVQDCFDAQYATGKVPSTVPHFHGDWDDDPNWGGSAIFVPYRNWQMYGDKRLMTKHYDGMKRLIDYYTSMTRDHLMPGSSYSALSDWGQGSSGLVHQIPAEFTITTSYYYLLNAMSEMAAELGHTDDAATFAETAEEVKKAFNARFFHAETGVYDYGNQGDYGMPLYYGLVDAENEERVAAKLAESVCNADYKIKTGEIALKPVLMSLAKYGYNDIVYQMANQTDYPSYGYWVKQGCTTTPELWNMEYSQNHCMMNHIEEWFYSQLGGIQMADGAEGIGFHRFVIRPWMSTDLAHMRARTKSLYGEILSEYMRTADGIDFHFVVPANTKATLVLPAFRGQLKEAGREVTPKTAGVERVEYGDSTATLVVGSGEYRFRLSQ
jgi:alpha-L-rhamnosidase